ncbi:MAG TPA: MFS transporter [Burkholderiales bacterium]|jgi:MFS family permease
MGTIAAPGYSAVGAQQSVEQKRKAAVRGAFLSEYIDMFDIYLPVVVLSPILAYFQPPHLDAATDAILGSLVFMTTFLGRPLGSIIFGIFADRIGRRRATIISVAGFGVVTLLIALLPGYETWGLASYVLLILLRFVDGIFLGGGYTGAHPLALEYSKKAERGFVGGLIIAAFPAAYVTINLVSMATFAIFPLDGMHSPYAQIGWRVPFIIGAALAGWLTMYYINKVSESDIWEGEKIAKKTPKSPFAELLRGRGLVVLLQVMLMMTGYWLTQNLLTIFMPSGVLVKGLHLTGVQMSLTLMITYTIMFFSYTGFGVLGQRIGRRKFLMWCGPAIATVGAGLMYVLANSQGAPLWQIIVTVVVMAVVISAPWGVILAYVNERFSTEVRATGFGIGFSLSVVIPSFYAFYLNWLGQAGIPGNLAPSLLLILGGILGIVGASLGPETKDVDF